MTDPVTKFEAISANPNFISSRGNTGYGYTSGGSELGKRNNASLARGFAGSPILSNTYKITDASEKYQIYIGENIDFPQYRRNFIPDDTAGAEYQNVRDKNLPLIQLGDSGRPATPFSPNVASPTVPEGTLFVGVNQVQRAVTGSISINGQPLSVVVSDLNPINSKYKNLDSLGGNNDAGIVRRFNLGIGSTVGRTRAGRT